MTGFSLDDFTKINSPTRTKWAILGRRSRQGAVRAERQARADRDAAIEQAREQHYRRQKLYAAVLRDVGAVIPLNCDTDCPICHPPAPAHDPAIEIRDLRGGAATKKRPSGKKGTCRICGKICLKSLYYHKACRLEPPPTKKPIPTCRWCAHPLPEGSSPLRKWCSVSCCSKAQRARR